MQEIREENWHYSVFVKDILGGIYASLKKWANIKWANENSFTERQATFNLYSEILNTVLNSLIKYGN